MSDVEQTPEPPRGAGSPLNVLGGTGGDLSSAGAEAGRRELEPGTRVDRYVITREIGSGGMGTVYAAYDPDLDRRVALKVVHAGDEDDRAVEASRARLLREAKACASLTHPNVVKVYGVGVHGGQVFIAMEYVEGQSLRDWLREVDRDWRDVVRVFVAAGRGLAAAHQAGFVHRDFKPDNVLIRSDGRVKVVDFGLARAHGEAEPSSDESTERARRVARRSRRPRPTEALTRTGATVGTPAYMSPEQHRAEPADPRSDQFAFCVALWEALYGARPFDRRSYVEVARAKARGEIEEPPRSLRARVPDWLDRAVRTGMAPMPEARHGSMQELVELLARRGGRPPKRRALVPLTLLLGATLGIALWQGLWAPAGPCTGGEDRVATAWSSSQRRAVRGRLGHGSEAVIQGLDDYAVAWTRAHERVCREAKIEGTRDADWLDGRSTCLERHLDALRGLVHRLEAGRGADDDALAAVAALPDVASCLRESITGEGAPLPADPALAEKVRRERQLLERALAGAGDDPAASLVSARSVLERARALGDRALEADALVGIVRISDGDGVEPAVLRPLLHEAAQAAIMSGHDETALDAWVQLAAGLVEEEPESAARWVDYAARLSARLDRPPRQEVRIGVLEARVALSEGRTRDALRHASVAIARAEREWGGEHEAVVDPLLVFGDALLADGRVEEARSRHERALEVATLRHGDRALPIVPVLLRLAETELEDAPGPALARAEQAIELVEGHVSPNHPWRARALLVAARAAVRLEDWERADELASRGLEEAEARAGSFDVSLVPYLRVAGVAAHGAGRHEEARTRSGRAVELLEGGGEVERLGAARLELARHLAAVDERGAARDLARRVITTCGAPCRERAESLLSELGG